MKLKTLKQSNTNVAQTKMLGFDSKLRNGGAVISQPLQSLSLITPEELQHKR